MLRGNVTSQYQWLNVSNSFAGTGMTYDIAGNLLTLTDPDGHATTLNYSDPNSTFAHPTTITNAAGQKTTIQYDYGSSKPSSATDPNNQVTGYTYAEGGDRLTQIQWPNGGHQYESYPNQTTVVTQQDQNTSGDAALKSQVLYDGLGRPKESDSYESSSSYIAATTTYDAAGRVPATTNPSRSGDGLNYTTSYTYDSLGRALQVQTADNAVAASSYTGNQTTLTDQAGKVKQLTYDALGRLTKVVEDPAGLNYSTAYSYDAQNNLTLVVQGAQQRGFTYDSRSNLLSAQNPESGGAWYTYDAAGNLLTRTDARNATTTYTYDALNRLTGKTYPAGTPAVAYTYDPAVGNGIGQLGTVTNTNAATTYSLFDSLGNVKTSSVLIGGQTYTFAYSYDLAGGLTSETYPSGRVVTTAYDGAHRPSALAGSLAGQGKSYVSAATYWPHGAEWAVTYGNSVVPVYSYNARLQPSWSYTTIANNGNSYLSCQTYSWGTANNNGSLQSAAEGYGSAVPYASLSWLNQSYSYDKVKRLTGVSDSGYSRTFGYDTYGNAWVTGNSGVPLAGNTPAANVFNASNQIGTAYDAAGNQTAVNGNTIAYDAESRQISAAEPAALGGGVENYLYDGGGQRVEKTGPGGTTVYVYDALGRMAAEYGATGRRRPAPLVIW